jgi:hypothetical protein
MGERAISPTNSSGSAKKKYPSSPKKVRHTRNTQKDAKDAKKIKIESTDHGD